MEDVVRPDFTVTLDIMKELLLVALNEEWEDTVTWEARSRIGEMVFVLVAGSCCGFRGEEIVKIDIILRVI
jgi:hypothetical protein